MLKAALNVFSDGKIANVLLKHFTISLKLILKYDLKYNSFHKLLYIHIEKVKREKHRFFA